MLMNQIGIFPLCLDYMDFFNNKVKILRQEIQTRAFTPPCLQSDTDVVQNSAEVSRLKFLNAVQQ